MIRMILGALMLLPVVATVVATMRRPATDDAGVWVPLTLFAIIGMLLAWSGWRALTRPGPRCVQCRSRLPDVSPGYAAMLKHGAAVLVPCANREVNDGFTYSRCPSCKASVGVS